MQNDTIVAAATAIGNAAVAIIRLSGDRAVGIAKKIFSPSSEAAWSTRELRYGHVSYADGAREEAMAVYFLPPHTYTREPVAELHIHGSAVTTRMLVSRCVQLGARIADPGEFTKRAFLNGRIDLLQAEAVMGVISAQTEKQARAAMRQMSGGLSSKVEKALHVLIDVVAAIEAVLDYPEEDLTDDDIPDIPVAIGQAQAVIAELLSGAKVGQRLKDGYRVVLAGQPNAGKSSLFNALLGLSRAIVTRKPGTTRDALSELIDMNGLPVWLTDTAGIRQSDDEIENLGIGRAKQEIRNADMILHVVDSPEDLPASAEMLAEIRDLTAAPVWRIENKIDLVDDAESVNSSGGGVYRVSALKGTGIEELKQAIYQEALRNLADQPILLAQERHIQALRGAMAHLDEARRVFEGLSLLEFVAIDLREAANELGSLIGAQVSDLVIDKIFSTFCLGK